jgi:hypothetical protein
MMNSASTDHDSADATSTSAGPQADADAPASSHDDQNPLWLITAAMAIFFIAAAAILAAG